MPTSDTAKVLTGFQRLEVVGIAITALVLERFTVFLVGVNEEANRATSAALNATVGAQ